MIHGVRHAREVKLYKYIGETSRNPFERGIENLSDLRQLKTGSHILKHLINKHEGEKHDKIDFRMRVLK